MFAGCVTLICDPGVGILSAMLLRYSNRAVGRGSNVQRSSIGGEDGTGVDVDTVLPF